MLMSFFTRITGGLSALFSQIIMKHGPRLLGRYSAGQGVAQEIKIGAGLVLDGDTLRLAGSNLPYVQRSVLTNAEKLNGAAGNSPAIVMIVNEGRRIEIYDGSGQVTDPAAWRILRNSFRLFARNVSDPVTGADCSINGVSVPRGGGFVAIGWISDAPVVIGPIAGALWAWGTEEPTITDELPISAAVKYDANSGVVGVSSMPISNFFSNAPAADRGVLYIDIY